MIDSPDESSREKVELQVDQGPDAYITDTTVDGARVFALSKGGDGMMDGFTKIHRDLMIVK